MSGGSAVAFQDLQFRFGKVVALKGVSLEIASRRLVGLIGPDGVGKSTLLSLITGSRALQKTGSLQVLGGDMRDAAHREKICPRVAYMPQGLGKNLYFTLTVEENLQFFAKLFGHDEAERRRRIDDLTKSTGLYPFLDRPAGKLSGGMKQKLGLCCSLIHDPDLLVLDEPTTGVDPLARRQFWDLIDRIRETQPNLTVLVATAYMDEAQRFDWLIAMDEGKILDTGTPRELLEKTGAPNLDTAFIRLLPEERRAGHRDLVVPPLPAAADKEISIEAEGLTKRFGSFTAVDHVSFRIRRGEIFGFLGSNGCGKTTTMRMLTGLLPATEGNAKLFGKIMDPDDMDTRKHLGYMTQLFSLYSELSVRQNLKLYARLYGLPEAKIASSVEEMLKRFQLEEYCDTTPNSLPLGIKQRLSLAAAVIHHPDILILDEPTSGVDPVARDSFWELIISLSRDDKVTIFITTHFMNEAERCDRISLMHSGRSLACDTPANLVKERQAPDLESAFIGYLEDAAKEQSAGTEPEEEKSPEAAAEPVRKKKSGLLDRIFSISRCVTCFQREMLELRRDGIRLTLALFGAMILLIVIGYGITLDVDNIDYAVMDCDRSELSSDYLLNISGSRYFREHAPVSGYDEMDRRLRNGELSLVVEVPPGFAKDVQRGKNPQIAFWVDGGDPSRAETINGYITAMHAKWQERYAQTSTTGPKRAGISIQNRYCYNPDVKSLPAMVPAVIPVLLMMIPAILAALSVVREKELGSIINLYVTPLRRSEFVLGKQFPYVLFSFVSSILLVIMAETLFEVPIKGSVSLLLASLLVYCVLSTGFGLICSSVTRSQIAVIFLTLTVTMMPAVQLCGLTNPVSDEWNMAGIVGHIYPTTYMLLISRGVFNKGLYWGNLYPLFLILAAEIVVIEGVCMLLQKKQES